MRIFVHPAAANAVSSSRHRLEWRCHIFGTDTSGQPYRLRPPSRCRRHPASMRLATRSLLLTQQASGKQRQPASRCTDLHRRRTRSFRTIQTPLKLRSAIDHWQLPQPAKNNARIGKLKIDDVQQSVRMTATMIQNHTPLRWVAAYHRPRVIVNRVASPMFMPTISQVVQTRTFI